VTPFSAAPLAFALTPDLVGCRFFSHAYELEKTANPAANRNSSTMAQTINRDTFFMFETSFF
jgi:hypothetical protein